MLGYAVSCINLHMCKRKTLNVDSVQSEFYFGYMHGFTQVPLYAHIQPFMPMGQLYAAPVASLAGKYAQPLHCMATDSHVHVSLVTEYITV